MTLVARPRLIELMTARWRLRAIAVVAGPGFGKSVLLSEAMAENALAPRGVDLFVACTEADRTPSRLLRRIADSAGIALPVGAEVSIERLLGELSRRWPLGVCVIIDDVHHVCHNVAGGRLVTRLVTEAPSAVHFVLAGRAGFRGLAAARAAGEVMDIGEDQLSLSSAEIAELAALQGVDPVLLASVGGWPAAAVMAATYGVSGADEYVFEAVLDHLDDGERTVLAIAAAIGGGDPPLLRRAIGATATDLVDVLTRLPLVSRSTHGEFIVHDLWRRVVGDTLEADVLRTAVANAVDALVEREQFDRAFGLCASHGHWDRAGEVLTACCRRGHVEVSPDVLAGWLDSLPADRRDEPAGLLLRGLAGRVTDPFGELTGELLERAVAGYRARGDVAGEIAAGVELVFVLRNQGRGAALPEFLARAVELDEAGHVEAAGPAAVARALLAELSGDDAEVIARLDAIPDRSLSATWQTVVAARQTICNLVLGDDHAMLEAATRCSDLAGEATDRHMLALARWFAGDPSLALATCDDIAADAGRSRVDGVFLGTVASMILSSAGRTNEAAARLASTERAASGPLSSLMAGALVGARALLAAASGDDDSAQRILEGALAGAPLSNPIGWRTAARWLPLAYVLVPSIRDDLDGRPLGPMHRRRLAVARAVGATRDGRPLPAIDEITPQGVATSVPLPWAMALCSRLKAEGSMLGTKTAQYLHDLFGEPARDALRATVQHPDPVVATGARKLLAVVTAAPPFPLRLDVLGPTTLRLGTEEPLNDHWNRDRVRALLLYLVIHGPAHREQIIDALWPHLDLGAADRNLRVTLSYLQQVLEPRRRSGEAPFYVRQEGPTLALARPKYLDVDLVAFESLVDRATDADHRGLPSVALELLEAAVALWRGPCLAGHAYEEWAQATSRAATERFVAASTRAAELHLAAGQLERAVQHARRALSADEWSEPAYGIVVAAALARGDGCGAARALAECEAMLGALGVPPSAQTEMLRRRLDNRSRLSA